MIDYIMKDGEIQRKLKQLQQNEADCIQQVNKYNFENQNLLKECKRNLESFNKYFELYKQQQIQKCTDICGLSKDEDCIRKQFETSGLMFKQNVNNKLNSYL
ncbi:hypothetical protein pb186bvf_018868 [Paramecium bursaria]